MREATGSVCLGRLEGLAVEVVDSSKGSIDSSAAVPVGISLALTGGELVGSSCSSASSLPKVTGSVGSAFSVEIGASVGIGSRTGVSDTAAGSS